MPKEKSVTYNENAGPPSHDKHLSHIFSSSSISSTSARCTRCRHAYVPLVWKYKLRERGREGREGETSKRKMKMMEKWCTFEQQQ